VGPERALPLGSISIPVSTSLSISFSLPLENADAKNSLGLITLRGGVDLLVDVHLVCKFGLVRDMSFIPLSSWLVSPVHVISMLWGVDLPLVDVDSERSIDPFDLERFINPFDPEISINPFESVNAFFLGVTSL